MGGPPASSMYTIAGTAPTTMKVAQPTSDIDPNSSEERGDTERPADRAHEIAL